MEFRLPSMGEEVEAIGGRYLFVRRGVLRYASRRVLYLVGCAVADRSCCGCAGCSFALVAGFMCGAGNAPGPGGRAARVVECIPEEMHVDMARILMSVEPVGQVQFLCGDGMTKVVF
jgi:hypothetical protein